MTAAELYWPIVLGGIVFLSLLLACLWRMRLLEEKKRAPYLGEFHTATPYLVIETPEETEA